MKRPVRVRLSGGVLGLSLGAVALVGCYATVEPAHEECRTVEVRNRRDVEACHTRCGDEGCRTRCRERERYSREHRCWVE